MKPLTLLAVLALPLALTRCGPPPDLSTPQGQCQAQADNSPEVGQLIAQTSGGSMTQQATARQQLPLARRRAYIACLHGHGANEVVAFLICEVCGGVDEDSSPAMKKAVAAIAETRQFSPSHQMVEIVGRCEHCRNTAS